MEIGVLGIDLAKTVFHLIGCDEKGKEIYRRMVKRGEPKKVVMGFPPCQIAMEACGSASYWARELQTMGHEVKLIPPPYVKPFVKTNKNDFNDALAITEAVVRPNMTFAAVKTEGEQDLQSLHRIRCFANRQMTLTRWLPEEKGSVHDIKFWPKLERESVRRKNGEYPRVHRHVPR